MLIVDSLLLSPFRGLFWIFEEIYAAAQAETGQRREEITGQLSDLYMMLETGQISEAEFDAQEQELLDALDELDAEDA